MSAEKVQNYENTISRKEIDWVWFWAFQPNVSDEKGVELITGDKNENEEKEKKPRFELGETKLALNFGLWNLIGALVSLCSMYS